MLKKNGGRKYLWEPMLNSSKQTRVLIWMSITEWRSARRTPRVTCVLQDTGTAISTCKQKQHFTAEQSGTGNWLTSLEFQTPDSPVLSQTPFKTHLWMKTLNQKRLKFPEHLRKTGGSVTDTFSHVHQVLPPLPVKFSSVHWGWHCCDLWRMLLLITQLCSLTVQNQNPSAFSITIQ